MALNIEKVLRGLETEEKIFRGSKRVQTIKAVDCIKALSRKGLDAQTIKNEINTLLENYKLVKVRVNEKNPEIVDISIAKNVGANDVYMWGEEKYDFMSLFIGISVIVLIFSFAMFRAWPNKLQRYFLYIRYPAYVVLGLYVLILVVRLIVYCITVFTHPPGLWILPNSQQNVDFLKVLILGMPGTILLNLKSRNKCFKKSHTCVQIFNCQNMLDLNLDF